MSMDNNLKSRNNYLATAGLPLVVRVCSFVIINGHYFF